MQNIPLNQLSPEMIQMLLTQGMFQPIEQANPYVNMLDPNMNQLAYSVDNWKRDYGTNKTYDQLSPTAQKALLNIQFNNPNLTNRNDSLYQVDKRAFDDFQDNNSRLGSDSFDAPTTPMTSNLPRVIYKDIQEGRL